MSVFNLKRGDSVIINTIDSDTGIVESDTGIVLNVEQKPSIDKPTIVTQIEVRRDVDGSLWTVDENGKMFSFGDEPKQFIQVQKIFKPVEVKRGKVVSMIMVYNGGDGPRLEVWDAGGQKAASITFNPEHLIDEPVKIHYMDERSFRAIK